MLILILETFLLVNYINAFQLLLHSLPWHLVAMLLRFNTLSSDFPFYLLIICIFLFFFCIFISKSSFFKVAECVLSLLLRELLNLI